MSQFTFGNIDETVTDGYDLAAFLEEFEAAVNSDHSGPTAPVYAIQGMTWRDTSGTPHLIKKYDGASWVTTGDLNPTTHVYRAWSNGAVLGALSGYGVGNGLEVDSNNLRIKLDGTSLARSSSGLKVADKGITVGMIGDSTDGGLWTWGADGVATLLAPGAAGTALHAAGPGAPLYWDEVTSGLEYIGSASIAGVASTSITFDPAVYKTVQLFLRNINSNSSPYQVGTYIRPLVASSLVNWTYPSIVEFVLPTRSSRSASGCVTLWDVSGTSYKCAKFEGTSYTANYPTSNTDALATYDQRAMLVNANNINGFYLNCSYINATGAPVWGTGSQIALYGLRN